MHTLPQIFLFILLTSSAFFCVCLEWEILRNLNESKRGRHEGDHLLSCKELWTLSPCQEANFPYLQMLTQVPLNRNIPILWKPEGGHWKTSWCPDYWRSFLEAQFLKVTWQILPFLFHWGNWGHGHSESQCQSLLTYQLFPCSSLWWVGHNLFKTPRKAVLAAGEENKCQND